MQVFDQNKSFLTRILINTHKVRVLAKVYKNVEKLTEMTKSDARTCVHRFFLVTLHRKT